MSQFGVDAVTMQTVRALLWNSKNYVVQWYMNLVENCFKCIWNNNVSVRDFSHENIADLKWEVANLKQQIAKLKKEKKKMEHEHQHAIKKVFDEAFDDQQGKIEAGVREKLSMLSCVK